MCGIAGSGKTTYAQGLERDGYVRLSIDEEVWRRYGRYGVDYDPAAFPAHAAHAERALEQRLLTLVRQGRDVVVDFAFWRRANRDRYKQLIQGAGGTWTLVYLKTEPAELRRRLDRRAHRTDAKRRLPDHPGPARRVPRRLRRTRRRRRTGHHTPGHQQIHPAPDSRHYVGDRRSPPRKRLT